MLSPMSSRVPDLAVFVQARMSSRRFPGKVLAPFRGKPILDHVVDAARRGVPDVPVVVATSRETSDDPVAHHMAARGVACFRGELDDVVRRFTACLAEHPCAFVVRICADSPLVDERVVRCGARWNRFRCRTGWRKISTGTRRK